MKLRVSHLLGALIIALGVCLIFFVDWNGWTAVRAAGNGVGVLVILAGLVYLVRVSASVQTMVTSRVVQPENGVLKNANGLVYALPGTVLKLTLLFRGQGEIREASDARTDLRALRIALVEEEFKLESSLIGDARKMFVLEPTEAQWWSLNEFKISISPEGLLQSVGGTLQDERQAMVSQWVEAAGSLLRPTAHPTLAASRPAPMGGRENSQSAEFANLEGVTVTIEKLYRIGEAKSDAGAKSGLDMIPLGREFTGIKLEAHERHAVVEVITRKANERVEEGQAGYGQAVLASDVALQLALIPEAEGNASSGLTAADLARQFSGTEDTVVEGILHVIPGGARGEARVDEASSTFYQARLVIPECGMLARLPMHAHPLSKSTLEVQFDSATGRATMYTRSSTPQSTEKIQSAYTGLMTGVDKAAEKDETLKQSLATQAQAAAKSRVTLVVHRALLQQTQAEIGELEKRPDPTEKTRLAIASRKRLIVWLGGVIAELEKGYDGDYGAVPEVDSMEE